MKRTMVVLYSLMLTLSVFSFTEDRQVPGLSLSAYENVNENLKFKRTAEMSDNEQKNENAKLKRSGDEFNNKTNKNNRAKERAEKESEKTRKKTEELQDKGEGQVNVKF